MYGEEALRNIKGLELFLADCVKQEGNEGIITGYAEYDLKTREIRCYDAE